RSNLSHDDGHSNVAKAHGSSLVIELAVRNAHDASEYAGLEEYLRGLRGITAVHLDGTRGVAHLSYDPAVTTPKAIEEHLNGCGYRCDCYVRPGSVAQPGHPRVGTKELTEHAAAVKPEEPTAMDHGEPAGHGAAMVSDMFHRFIISTFLSLLLVIFSPLGGSIGLPGRPPFGLSLGLFGFLMATPVVWWGGWPFISAA